MKNKYIFWGNALLVIYSLAVLIFYLKKLFNRESAIDYFIMYEFKSLFLVLLLHFIYFVGACIYFYKKRYLSNLLISFGAIGFLVAGIVDCFLVSSYNPVLYTMYFIINLIILTTIGGSVYKIVSFILPYILIWIIITAMSYNFLNSILVI